MKKAKSSKLRLSKETMSRVAATAWHRTTHRCHETANCCAETMETFCDTQCITECYVEGCWYATITCDFESFCRCTLGGCGCSLALC